MLSRFPLPPCRCCGGLNQPPGILATLIPILGVALAAPLAATLTHACPRPARALGPGAPAPPTPGVTPRLLKRTLQTALVWTLYEDLVPRITQLGLAARQAWEERSRGGGRD